jgi:hypothetical protein
MFFLIILSLLSLSINENTTCTISENCDTCNFCGDKSLEYSTCNFENAFCHHVQNDNYEYNSKFKNYYSKSFREDLEINNFCDQRRFELSSMTETFTILDTGKNVGLLTNKLKINCDYEIINDYYYEHDSDQAKLSFEIKNSKSNNRISFRIFLIYQTGNNIRFIDLNDDKLRGGPLEKKLDSISSLDLLIDFKDNYGKNFIDGESLEITLVTSNPSKKTRIIILIITIICIVLIILIIVLIILYFVIKRRMEIRYRENLENEAKEKKKELERKQKLVKDLLEGCLKPVLFTKNTSINDCNSCTICIDTFEIDKSQISITPCNHIFHYDCIKKWIEDNVLNPQCPNCKYNFFDNFVHSSVVQINNNANNNEQNNNNQNNNVQNNNYNHGNNNAQINIIHQNNNNLRSSLSEQLRMQTNDNS